MARDDSLRTSDADRDRVTARLRDHFAEGRLTREELDERIAAALNAKTFGDLRRVLSDLPEPGLVGQQGRGMPGRMMPFPVARRGPRILPLALLVLAAALLIPGGGWIFLAFLKVVLVFWLVVGVVAMLTASRFRRQARYGQGYGYDRSGGWPGRYDNGRPRCWRP